MMQAQLQELAEVLEGLNDEDGRATYLGVLVDAAKVHVEKDNLRRGLWKEYPAKDQSFQIKVKADRLMRMLEGGDDRLNSTEHANALEECHDIINYCTFAARKLEGVTSNAN